MIDSDPYKPAILCSVENIDYTCACKQLPPKAQCWASTRTRSTPSAFLRCRVATLTFLEAELSQIISPVIPQ